MKIKINSFTHYNILLLFINYYYKNLYNLYAINTCLTYMIFITFHSSLLLDISTFKRIRIKNDFTYLQFHLGNFVLHTLPCMYVYNYPPQIILHKHSIIALFSKLLWCYLSTKGSMDLGEIYVKFTNKQVYILYLISSCSCLSIPLFYKNNLL